MAEIGFQLSSIAPYLDTAENLEMALYKIAQIGYRYVEMQGVPLHIPNSRIVQALKRNGLTCIAAHESYAFGFGSSPAEAIERAAACEAKYLTFSMIPPQVNTYDRLKRLAASLHHIEEKAEKAGLVFAYHPTAMDYRLMGKQPVFERLMGLLSDDVQLSFCVYNSFNRIPYAQILENYKNRVDVVHFMDSIVRADGAAQLMPLGEGDHNWLPIFDACINAGAKYILSEQTNWDRDAFECAALNFQYLCSLHK